MTALVVLAHPCGDSFAHAAAGRAVAGLEAGGHRVTLIDLYAENFAAAMTREEHRAYLTDTPTLDEQADRYGQLLRGVDIVVFVYPTWWSGLPAMLKGWLEKVLVPGVGFTFSSRGKVRPGLTNVTHIVGISTYGSPRLYAAAINDNGRRIITRAFRLACGARTRTTWMGLYAMDTSTHAERTDFLHRIEHKMTAI